MTRSIRTRLGLATAALILGVATLVLGGVYWATVSSLERDATDSVHAELRSLVEHWKDDGLQGLVNEVDRRSATSGGQGFAYLVAEMEQVHVAGNIREWPEGQPSEGEGTNVAVDLQQADIWVHKRIRLESIRLDDHRLLVGLDPSRHDALIAGLEGSALIALVFASILAIAAGLEVGRRLLGRVETMRDKIADILAGARGERVGVGPGNDEFDQLATQFNRLLDENERLIQRVSESTNNIAHDLRTPLQRMRGRLESALSESAHQGVDRALLEGLSEDTDQLLDTFNGLLQITRIESDDVRRAMEPTPLGALLDDIVDLYGPLAEEVGLALQVEVDPDLVVMAERQLLGQALANLVDNAIKYAPDGKSISVSAHRRDDRIVLSVADHGPGIPAVDRGRVLERLVRLDSARTVPGTGLGLSFVASVARLHGCDLELKDNGPGLRVEMSLEPASQPGHVSPLPDPTAREYGES